MRTAAVGVEHRGRARRRVPGSALTELAEHLRQRPGPLAALDAGDAAANVRAVFSWSYRALGPDAARMFRLLSLNPGPDIGAGTAASLAAADPEQALAALGELVAAHLLAEPVAGRYACHDLLRGYAAELTRATHPRTSETPPCTGFGPLPDTARHAAMLMEPHFDPVTLSPPQPGVIPWPLATAEEATAWFSAEHAGLLAAARLAGQAGFDTHAWQLAWTLSTFFLRSGAWEDHTLAQRAGLAAARRTHDVAGEAHALHGLALGYARSGRFAEELHISTMSRCSGRSVTRSARRESTGR